VWISDNAVVTCSYDLQMSNKSKYQSKLRLQSLKRVKCNCFMWPVEHWNLYNRMKKKIAVKISRWWLWISGYSEDIGSRYFRNVASGLSDYTGSHRRRLLSSSSEVQTVFQQYKTYPLGRETRKNTQQYKTYPLGRETRKNCVRCCSQSSPHLRQRLFRFYLVHHLLRRIDGDIITFCWEYLMEFKYL
jgi:hypothetical protein